MKNRTLYILWAAAYALCAGLGFVTERGAALEAALTILALLFYLPPALLLRRSKQTGQRDPALLIRNLSALSLGLTAALLVITFLTVLRSETLGTVLHCLLVVVSAPMFCGGTWAMSLFLWACLLVASIQLLHKMKRP